MNLRTRSSRWGARIASCAAVALTAALVQSGAAHASQAPFPLPQPWNIVGTSSSNIFWYNGQSGQTQIWFMNHNSVLNSEPVVNELGSPTVIGPPFAIVGSADMNGDGNRDLVWYNSSTGETQIWFLNGNQLVQRATVVDSSGTPALVGPPFSIVGTADIDGDGKGDLVWHNSSTGETQIWFMNGNQVVRRATVVDSSGTPALVGPPFSIVGTADINGDGKGDLVWHNSSTGETRLWYLNANAQIIAEPSVVDASGALFLVGSPWSIVGAADVDKDGTGDIVTHNSQTGDTRIWFMSGNRLRDQEDVVQGTPTTPPPGTKLTLFNSRGCVATETLEETDSFIDPSGNVGFPEEGDNATCTPGAAEQFTVTAAGNVSVGVLGDWRIQFSGALAGRFQLVNPGNPSQCLATGGSVSAEFAQFQLILDPTTGQSHFGWVNVPVTYNDVVGTATCSSAVNQQFAM